MKYNADTIRKYIDAWMRPLGLLWWEVKVNYYDDPETVLDKFGNDDAVVLARTTTYWEYGTATIDFNLIGIQQLDNEGEVEMMVVHELCHILVSEMREGEIHHEERVVTGLTKAFMWTRGGE